MNHDTLILNPLFVENHKIIIGDDFNECLDSALFNVLNQVKIICIDAHLYENDKQTCNMIIANSNYKFGLNKMSKNHIYEPNMHILNKAVKKINKTVLKNFINDFGSKYINFNCISIYGLWEDKFVEFRIETAIPYYGDKINKCDSFTNVWPAIEPSPDIYADKIAIIVIFEMAV